VRQSFWGLRLTGGNAVLQLRDPLVDVPILNPFNYQEFEDGKLAAR